MQADGDDTRQDGFRSEIYSHTDPVLGSGRKDTVEEDLPQDTRTLTYTYTRLLRGHTKGWRLERGPNPAGDAS